MAGQDARGRAAGLELPGFRLPPIAGITDYIRGHSSTWEYKSPKLANFRSISSRHSRSLSQCSKTTAFVSNQNRFPQLYMPVLRPGTPYPHGPLSLPQPASLPSVSSQASYSRYVYYFSYGYADDVQAARLSGLQTLGQTTVQPNPGRPVSEKGGRAGY